VSILIDRLIQIADERMYKEKKNKNKELIYYKKSKKTRYSRVIFPSCSMRRTRHFYCCSFLRCFQAIAVQLRVISELKTKD